MRLTAAVVLGGFLVLGMSQTAGAQAPAAASPTEGGAAIAFINVNVISMEDDRVQTGQTVLVQGDRIVAIGARAVVVIPDSPTVIDGAGKYLVPGLTDAHVHLEGDGTRGGQTRPEFGDAPLYLAHGITTVFNLGGTPAHLDWRRQIERGQMAGPTIYTSGAFVNEPRVNTVDEVDREIREQARVGYDLIKFHEIYTHEAGFLTTTGLSLASYRKMNEVAREIGIPLVGHAPVNLGLEVLLQARQPLAHLGMLSNLHFLPLASNRPWLLVTAGAIVGLTMLGIMSGVAMIGRRLWRKPRPSSGISGVRALVWLQWLACILAAVSGASFFPGGPLFDSLALRLLFTLLILLMASAALILVVSTARIWRASRAAPGASVEAGLASVASVALVCAVLVFWLPVAWRSSDAGIERLARRIHDAGIPVQTTLVAYDAIGGPGKSGLATDPAIDSLRADVRTRWRRFSQPGPAGYRYTDFMKKVAGALHRAGVPLMAGTDAMGAPLIAPGSSLHRELALLTEGGLTPYEAMRTATVVPASFLGKEEEFGTIAAGKRADLLLLDGNPLEEVTRLRQPIGVMTRGRWFTREHLQQMLAALAQGQ